jgi:NADH:ubiquinone oxidoreductase subunit 6 (subunit J)
LLTLVGVITRTEWHKGPERQLAPTTAQIGELFMRDYVLPFEVASIFLLIALIGAAMIVRRRGMQ